MTFCETRDPLLSCLSQLVYVRRVLLGTLTNDIFKMFALPQRVSPKTKLRKENVVG